jgi:hypothetical protein
MQRAMSETNSKPLWIRMSDHLAVIGFADVLVDLATWRMPHVEPFEPEPARDYPRPLFVSFLTRRLSA